MNGRVERQGMLGCKLTLQWVLTLSLLLREYMSFVFASMRRGVSYSWWKSSPPIYFAHPNNQVQSVLLLPYFKTHIPPPTPISN